MKRAQLTADHRTVASVYAALARDLGFPPHFAANLDALYDVLSRDVPGPVEIVWRDARAARLVLGEDFERIVATLKDVARERSDFRLTLR